MNWQKLYAQMGPLVASFCHLGDSIERLRPPLRSGFCQGRFTNAIPTKYSQAKSRIKVEAVMEITKALSALQPLYGKGNIEIVTNNGHRVRGHRAQHEDNSRPLDPNSQS